MEHRKRTWVVAVNLAKMPLVHVFKQTVRHITRSQLPLPWRRSQPDGRPASSVTSHEFYRLR